MTEKNYILIVDDDTTVQQSLQLHFEYAFDLKCLFANSKKEAQNKLIKHHAKILVSIIDLDLPDSSKGELIDITTKLKIPTIIFTSSSKYEDQFRKKNIIDFILKDENFSIDYLSFLINQLKNSYMQKVLIVDDSKVVLKQTQALLQRYNITCLTAMNGKEGLEVLSNNPDIKIVFTDYTMPVMDGLEFTQRIRKRYPKEKLAIVTISDTTDKKIISKFLRYGANDFLHKGFSHEEFFIRLNSVLDTLTKFILLSDRANKDFLTNMYNRRYFFTEGLAQYTKYDNVKLFMIDIDKFKNINDTYGHDIGDIALKETSNIIFKNLDKTNSITARFGGEEFCTIMFNYSDDEFKSIMENLRKDFENNTIETKKGKVSFTISIGYTLTKAKSIDDMIIEADKGLYRAKASGRNQVRDSLS